MITNQKGQSLFEIVFAVGIAALVLVGIVSVAAVSIRNTTFSQNKTKATKYTQEAVEWLREQRDIDWTNLSDHSNSGGIMTGLGELDWNNSSNIVGTSFDRTVLLETDANPSQIKATTRVIWIDGQGEHIVESITYFTDWTRRL